MAGGQRRANGAVAHGPDLSDEDGLNSADQRGHELREDLVPDSSALGSGVRQWHGLRHRHCHPWRERPPDAPGAVLAARGGVAHAMVSVLIAKTGNGMAGGKERRPRCRLGRAHSGSARDRATCRCLRTR